MSSSISELKTTIYLTPVVNTLFKGLSRFCLKLTGWKIVGQKPAYSKYIVIAAPHTSNWDFIILVMAGFILRWDIHWMGKDSLFPWPVKRLMIWLGGIPIDRSKSNRVVDQMAAYFDSVDQLSVLIPPEGTRSRVEQWKTGFYHIARQANVPIILGFLNAGNKTAGFGPEFKPSGDIEADMLSIQAFYKDFVGIKPRNG